MKPAILDRSARFRREESLVTIDLAIITSDGERVAPPLRREVKWDGDPDTLLRALASADMDAMTTASDHGYYIESIQDDGTLLIDG